MPLANFYYKITKKDDLETKHKRVRAWNHVFFAIELLIQ